MLFSTVRNIAIAAAMALGAGTAAPAMAACGTGSPYLLNYSFDMSHRVTAIAKYNQYLPDCGDGIANSDTVDTGTSTLTDVFAKRDPIGRTLLLGIATDLPGDPEGQDHLVLFTNDAWAASANHIAFGTLLPGVNEASLIAALNSLQAGTGNDADYSLLFDFAQNAAQFGPNHDAAFTFGSSFTAIAFSDGQIIGTGQSFLTPAPNAVPEPAAWALMIGGLGLVGAMSRKRAVPAMRLA